MAASPGHRLSYGVVGSHHAPHPHSIPRQMSLPTWSMAPWWTQWGVGAVPGLSDLSTTSPLEIESIPFVGAFPLREGMERRSRSW